MLFEKFSLTLLDHYGLGIVIKQYVTKWDNFVFRLMPINLNGHVVSDAQMK